ncbi:MAG: hypothetical protein K9N34_09755 [Candidatus Marinimicrobia bacterium]|nr:hypothetical protein [Candidatus Neomarinimicrobiota bacterium]MCF7839614.1 hypothetical protein [Candidatus Neomarinimicrobiota bacterium]
MLSDRLASFLEHQADRLTASWVAMLKSNHNTPSYHDIEENDLVNRIHNVYEKLSMWLDWEISSGEVARFFITCGAERKAEDTPLSESIYAIILARRNLFDHLMEQSVIQDALDLQRLIEFNSRVTYFFDKAVYFVIKGYEGFEPEKAEREGLLDRILHAFGTGTSPLAKH